MREPLKPLEQQLFDFLLAHEKWEADLIMSNEAWGGGMDQLPKLTWELYDSWMELQAMRNCVKAEVEKRHVGDKRDA